MAERAEERGAIPAQLPARPSWRLPLLVRRLLAMPLRDPITRSLFPSVSSTAIS